MNRGERRLFLDPGRRGLVLSPQYRLSRHSFRNLVLVAPTDSGKATRHVIPQGL
jgi:hypothetical protein